MVPGNLRIAAGTTYEVEIGMRMTAGLHTDGRLTVAIDGARQLTYSGSLGFDDTVGPYMKFGIYKFPWKTIHAHWRGYTETTVREYTFLNFSVIRADSKFGIAPAI